MSTPVFPLGSGTAAPFNSAVFPGYGDSQDQVPLVPSLTDYAFSIPPLPVDPVENDSFVDLSLFTAIPSTSITVGSNCMTGYSAVIGLATIGFCAYGSSLDGAIWIARCAAEFNEGVIPPPPPPPPTPGNCPPIAVCDIVPDLTFLQEPNE